MNKTVLSIATVVAAASLMLAPAVAHANTGTESVDMPTEFVDESFFSGDPSAPLGAGNMQGRGVTIPGNPYGCVGATETPHKNWNKVSVHTNIKCKTNSPELMETNVNLYKEGWFGQWHNLGHNGKVGEFVLTVDQHFKRNCVNQTSQNYRAMSFHFAMIQGLSYTVTTNSDQNRFICDAGAGGHQPN